MNYFISGGAKNGKSTWAEKIAVDMANERGEKLYYIATMIPHDSEDEARIARHIQSRSGKGFDTIECGTAISDLFNMTSESGDKVMSDGVFLLDSVTALLSNEMFRTDGSVDLNAPSRVANELISLCAKNHNFVFVSDYIYSDSLDFGELTEKYREGLAHIDKALAEVCDKVLEVSFGFVNVWK